MSAKTKSIEKIIKASDGPVQERSSALHKMPASPQNGLGFVGVQQAAGNLAVQNLFRAGVIQAKLSVSQPGDPDEQEADRIAERVVSSASAGVIQRKCAPCVAGATCPKCEEEEEKVQTKEKLGHTPHVDSKAASQIASLRGGGQPLPLSVRSFFEPRFGRPRERAAQTHSEEARSPRSPAPAPPTFAAAAGNRAVLRRFGGSPLASSSVVVSRPGDADESEADRVADAVMRMQPAPTGVPAGPAPGVRIRRLSLSARSHGCTQCTDEEPCSKCAAIAVQRSAVGGGAPAGSARSSGGNAAASAVSALRSGGEPLSSSDRAFFEAAFGRSMSEVRVHSHAEAGRSAREIGARAYTVGRDVGFAPGEYAPGTETGRRLLAHELAHVMQDETAEPGGAVGASIGTGGTRRLRRQLCEDPAEIVRNALHPPAPAAGAGGGPGPDAPAVTGEYLTPEQFEQITGISAAKLPESTFVGNDRLASLPEATTQEPLQRVATAAGPAALATPLPMSVIPANSIGVLWVAGHQSIFANVDGALTIRGYRANLLVHAGADLPGPAGRWFVQQLNTGVPGAFRGDLPFAYMNNQSVIYLETDPATAAQFAGELRAAEYGGEYRYSPPRPDAPAGSTERLMYERVYRARGAPRAVMCANNCITVPLREMDVVLGMHPTVRTPAGPLDVATGRIGGGPPNVFERGRAARMTEFMRRPDLSAGRPGLTSVTMTPAAVRAVGYIRVGGSILMVYGIYQSGRRLSEAWGTEEFPLVATSEGLSWTSSIVGSALGAAAVSALVCSPTGPVTAVCAVGGFLGGLIVGTAGAVLGSLIVPVMMRAAAGITEGLLMVIEGMIATAEIAGAIGRGITRGLIAVPLLSMRQTVNPCNWELIGLSTRTQTDVMALGLYLWHRLGTVGPDTFLARAGQPIRTQGTVPPVLLRDIAAGLSAAVRAQTGFDIEFTAEFVGGISPVEFVRQLHAYNLLRYRYDPEMLAELTARD